ncbi:DUF7289 family protein [Halomarina ordinaria]|uniref:Collagen-binding domain-containing protein n=1 Tax=Halomarina ordinaria TaxID=3033939 RepID=A0ABD5UIS9_9EURY|nr:collagen-binding domain-containing protein [Halomarina sp. PSRA2]
MSVRGFDDGRGQSHVVGVVLLLGLTVIGVGSVLLLGGEVLTLLQDSADAEAAEVAMTTLDSRASDVVLGTSGGKRVELGGRGTTRVDEDAGAISIEYVGCETCPRELANTTLGAVEYTTGSTTVAYQGGGVWRTDGEHAEMVSPPEFHYQRTVTSSGDPTLTFPLAVVRGTASGGTLQLSEGDATAVFPNETARNPLGAGSVRITIRSQYYEGWAAYFESRTTVESVDVDDDAETVELVLTIPNKSRNVTDGIASHRSDLRVQGGATVDSYDSSRGSYSETRGSNGSVYVGDDLRNAGGGTVRGDMRVAGDFDGGGGIDVTGDLITNGDVTLSGGVGVDGEVVADGDFSISGGGKVTSPVSVGGDVVETGGGVAVEDDVVAGGDYYAKSGSISGDVHVGGDFHAANGQNLNGDVTVGGRFDDDGVNPNVNGRVTEGAAGPDLSRVAAASDLTPPELTPIDATIDGRLEAHAARNNNTGSDVERLEAGNCGGRFESCTLTAGTYHLDDLTLSGSDALTFDTSDGPIHLAVDGDVSSTGGSTVNTVGSDRVHVYAGGDYTIRTRWESVGERGDQLWLYGSSGSTVTVQGGATLYGVIYAPANEDVTVRGGSEVYGGIVGSTSTVQGGTAVHYDTVLADQRPDLLGGGTAPVTYLHISVNELHVSDG